MTAGVDPRLAPFRTPAGAFTMLALDQRESLREMFPQTSTGGLVADAALAEFKATAAQLLAPYASGVLLDHPLGAPGPGRPAGVPHDRGLLLAADDLHSERGVGVVSTSVDAAITADLASSLGADGLKLLIIWRRGDGDRRDLLDPFHAVAEEAGLPTFVEGIVRPPEGRGWSSADERLDTLLDAAQRLSAGASVYKAEVPGYAAGQLERVEAAARELTAAIDVPWVVLSNGVVADEFGDAVQAACAGGAHGFLAGRAIWADTVADEAGPEAALRDRSVPRLLALSETVARAHASRRIDGEDPPA